MQILEIRKKFTDAKCQNTGVQKFHNISQRSALKFAHKMERDRKIGDRMKVVLLTDQGESLADIARFLFIDEQTARRHLKDYFDNDKLGGSSGGSEEKLSSEQTAES
ncbi:MAG: DNA-binding NarL/FixJ family response regulator [Rhodoferax sp.]|jgi:DNA-binding NarL/FixJ family response regulator